jgi:hypothetical protein
MTGQGPRSGRARFWFGGVHTIAHGSRQLGQQLWQLRLLSRDLWTTPAA